MKSITKFIPRFDREYIVTDQCMWKEMTPKDRERYNPYDLTRLPHTLQCVDKETGTVVHLPSGSIIKVVKARNEP